MILQMAWRNTWRNKLRSLIIMLSISIGLFAGIAVLALYKGMIKSRVRTVIDSEVGHLQIHHVNFKKDYEPRFIIAEAGKIFQKISAMPQVNKATFRSITHGMLNTATGSAGVQINGINQQTENEISKLNFKIIEGQQFTDSLKNRIIIGKKLADKMKLKLKSKLVLTFTDSSNNIVSAAFRVSAIYQSLNAPLDELNVYITYNDLNMLLGIGTVTHEIALILKNDEDLQTVEAQIKQMVPNLLVENWKQISPETDLMVNTTDMYSYIIMIIIMIALAFGIINTMLMAVLERTHEIGMMVALGTNRLKIFMLLFWETIFLTIVGIPVGLLIGWLVANYFNKNGLDMTGMGREMMSSFGYSTMIYPEFPTDKLWGVLLIVIGTAILACLFPAYKALKLQAVEALRR